MVELNPHSLNDRLALAQTAMMLRDYATATNALAGVVAADRNTVAYHNVAGAVAAAANQPAQAEAHFLEAVRLDPLNPRVAIEPGRRAPSRDQPAGGQPKRESPSSS